MSEKEKLQKNIKKYKKSSADNGILRSIDGVGKKEKNKRKKKRQKTALYLGHASGLELLGDGLDQGPGIFGLLGTVGVLDAPWQGEGGKP